jgi:hypothetical protein
VLPCGLQWHIAAVLSTSSAIVDRWRLKCLNKMFILNVLQNNVTELILESDISLGTTGVHVMHVAHKKRGLEPRFALDNDPATGTLTPTYNHLKHNNDEKQTAS